MDGIQIVEKRYTPFDAMERVRRMGRSDRIHGVSSSMQSPRAPARRSMGYTIPTNYGVIVVNP